ncbi:hypothetical protein BOTCAL_0021g00040 [Botryotinia calthae]|uniref:Uncharacterized protein n=1 Tax=Botryotinia calthae TaxID=38488 RepID=A0A4Y8DHA8_9HELO|nr:hypothetical protein BOTCAL_0021g00040 [Botryotinia calthae]
MSKLKLNSTNFLSQPDTPATARMSLRFWSHSPYDKEEMSEPTQQQQFSNQSRQSRQSRPGPWASESLSSEERVRRADLFNEDRQSEARAAGEAYEQAQAQASAAYEVYDQAQSETRAAYEAYKQAQSEARTALGAFNQAQLDFYNETWYQEASPASSGNPEFFQGSTQSKSAKQKKQEEKAQRAADKKRRQEARRAAEEEARKEKKHFENMTPWAYAKQWSESDRAAYGNAFDDFSASATAFIKDNTQEFPRLKKYGFARHNCVRGEILGICHHEVELTLRGSGAFDEKMMKKERLRWHPDRWTGKGDLQTKANELFQLIQRIIDGDVNA